MDEFLQLVRDVAAGDYEVFGELGRESDADIWYLARDRQTRKLVALRLKREGIGADQKPEYSLDVARELDKSVSIGAGECRYCGANLRRWARFCTQCGADLTDGGKTPTSPQAREQILLEVRAAAAEYYDVLGEMPWADGAGTVYFAIEKSSGRLVRLRLRQDAEGSSLGETRVMMELEERVQASYVTNVGSAPAQVSVPPASNAPISSAANRSAPPSPVQRSPRVRPAPSSPVTREQRLTIAVYVLAALVLFLLLRDLL